MNERLIEEYIKSLSEHELIILNFAKSHLNSLFDIEKTIGFLEWKSKL
jgi:hypothetical protein